MGGENSLKIQGLSIYADLVNDGVWAVLLFMPRTMIILQFWPLFSDTLSTQFMRASVAIGLACLPASYLIYKPDLISLSAVGILPYLAGEIVIGLTLGLMLSLPYKAVQAWGAMIDVIRGTTFASIVNPATQTDELVLERVAGFCFTLWFVSTPAFSGALQLLFDSYLKWPPSLDATRASWQVMSQLPLLMGEHLEWGIRLLMPVFCAIVLVELSLYIISAFIPTIQVYSIDSALKTVVCMGVLYLTAVLMPQVWTDYFDTIQKIPHERLQWEGAGTGSAAGSQTSGAGETSRQVRSD